MSRWFFSDGAITLESHLVWYADVAADPRQEYYGIEALLDPRSAAPLQSPLLVGVVGLTNIDTRDRTAEFGRFMVGHADFQRAGYGREAAYLLCDHAFTVLGLNKVWAEVIAKNGAAMSLYGSLGFEREGVLREQVFKDERYVDVVRVGVLERRFRELDAALRSSLGLDVRPRASG